MDTVEGTVMASSCVSRGLLRKNYKSVVFKDPNKLRLFSKMVISMSTALLKEQNEISSRAR